MSEKSAEAICASIDENVRRKRARAAVEDMRQLSVHSKGSAVPVAFRTLATIKPTESESEENKLLRASCEILYAAYQEECSADVFIPVIDGLHRIHITDGAVLPRRLHALQLACLLVKFTERKAYDTRVFPIIRTLLREAVNAGIALRSQAKLTSKLRRNHMLSEFGVPAVLSAVTTALQQSWQVFDLFNDECLDMLRQLAGRDKGITRCVAMTLQQFSKTMSALDTSRMDSAQHSFIHQLRDSLNRVLLSTPDAYALDVNAQCKYLHACAYSSAVASRCCDTFVNVVSGQDTIMRLLPMLSDMRPRVVFGALRRLLQPGLGQLLRVFGAASKRKPMQELSNMIVAMTKAVCTFIDIGLQKDDAPLLASAARAATNIGNAFCKFETAMLIAQRHNTLASKFHGAAGVAEVLPEETLLFASLGTREMHALTNACLRMFVHSVTIANPAYSHVIAITAEALLACVPLAALRLQDPRFRGSLCALFDAPHIFTSPHTLTRLFNLFADKCKAYSRTIPLLKRLPDALLQWWTRQSAATDAAMSGTWQRTNLLVPYKPVALFPGLNTKPVDAMTNIWHSYEQSLIALQGRRELAAGPALYVPSFAATVRNACSTLSAAQAGDFAGLNSVLMQFGNSAMNKLAFNKTISFRGKEVHLLQMEWNAQPLHVRRITPIIGAALNASYNDLCNVMASTAPKTPRLRKLKDLPFGIGSHVQAIPDLPMKHNLFCLGARLPLEPSTLYAPRYIMHTSGFRLRGVFQTSTIAFKRQSLTTPIFALHRAHVGFSTDPDFADSSKTSAERLVRRLHKCVGSYVIATSSFDSAALYARV